MKRLTRKLEKNRVQRLKVHFMSLIRFILKYVTLALAPPNIYPSFPNNIAVSPHPLDHPTLVLHCQAC
jgi:hypothetical protein